MGQLMWQASVLTRERGTRHGSFCLWVKCRVCR